VQLLMSFFEMTQPAAAGAAPVWPTLEPAQKDEIVAMLARLIARAADASSQATVDEEVRDD